MSQEKKRSLENLRIAAVQHTKEKDYWIDKLSGEWIKSRFPFDLSKQKKDEVKDSIYQTAVFEFSDKLSDCLLNLSNNSDPRLFIILVTGLDLLLHKYTGDKDIIIGSPIYKQDIEVELINHLVALRNKFEENMTVKQLLLQVRESIVEAIENYSYPIELLPEKLNLPYLEDDFPLFDVVILLENIHDKRYLQDIKTKMIFCFTNTGQNITGVLEYNSRFYQEAVIERIVRHLNQLFNVAFFNPDIPIKDIDILSGKEKSQLLVDFNDNKADFPKDKTVCHFVEEYAERNPGQIAIACEGSEHSYHQLIKSADQLSWILRYNGIKKDEPVGILCKRSLLMAKSILAVWKAGGAYIPIDPQYPTQRIIQILKDSRAKALITVSEYVRPDWERVCKCKAIVLDKDIENTTIPQPPGNSNLKMDMNRLAYIIYTSGSTGSPKGVMVEHIGMMNHIQAKISDLRLTSKSFVAQNASHTFDISVWQFFAALVVGGKTIIYPNELVLEVDQFISRLIEDRITVLEVVPSYLSVILDNLDVTFKTFESLIFLLVTGETVTPKLVEKWFEKHPKVKVVNAYGPTEASDDITHHTMAKPPGIEQIPIGKPLQNLNIYIVDKKMQLCPIGVKGEIYVSGVGVGRGYLNEIEKTNEVFIADPFVKEKNLRLYRTGDIGCWLPDGAILFWGRTDNQVKIRGFRIELEEIESKLLKHPDIKEAVVTACENERGERYLCAYIVGTTKGRLNIQGIKEYLSKSLPAYMVPEHLVEMKHLPLTPNGKINRKVLPEPGIKQSAITYITEKMLNTIAESSKDDLMEQDGIEQYISFPEEGERISYPIDKTMHELFEEQVEKTPDSIALVGSQLVGAVTYRELEKMANQLAQVLIVKGIKPGDIIALLAEPSLEVIIGILAILKAGGAYLPLDPENPAQRIKFFIEDCACTILFTQKKIEGKIGKGVEVIDLEDVSLYKSDTSNRKHLEIYRPHGAAYVAYTSGSTGKPKGVSITHANFCSLMQWGKDYLPSFANERVAQNNAYFFDWSVWEMFLTLTSGSSLHIVSPEVMFDVESYYDFIRTNTITVLHTTPTHFEFFTGLNKKLETLKYLFLGAEKLTYGLVERSFRFVNRDCRVFNMYGPTEATIISSTLEIDRSVYKGYKNLSSVPIGTASGNTDLLVLDKDLKICPVYRKGELHIAGDSVAGGYLNDPEKTSNKFIKNIFAEKGVRGRYLYKTGDLVRWLPDANLEFLGRIDTQSKISGFRIEPGEIENVLVQYGDISGAVIIVKEDNTGNKFICAFLVSDKKLEQLHLREFLSNELPPNMIPSYFVQLEKIPMTRNGKADRKALSEYEVGRSSTTPYMTEEMLKQSSVPAEKPAAALEIPDDDLVEENAISEEERKQVLVEFNQTAVDYPKGNTIHQLFEEQVEKSPGNAAVVFENSHLTYYQLNKKSNQLARFLRGSGVTSGSIVSIIVERSLEMMIGLLGILKAGSAYMPIEPEEPEERRVFILKGANSGLLLVNNDLEMPGYDIKIIDLNNQKTYQGEGSNLTHINGPIDLSYVLHTSGTTGKPKGVMIEHRAVLNFIKGMTDIIDFGERDRVLSLTTLSFDIFVLEAFIPLTTGLPMIVCNREQQLEIRAAASVIERENITIIQTTPSVMRLLISDPESAKSLQSLKYLLIGGEAFPAAVREKLKKISRGKILNLYGPTETTVWATAKDVTGNKSLNIGKPIANTQIYILDRNQAILPPGAAGELYIGGDGVARGYLNKPGLTKEKFVTNPFVKGDNIYKTGDIAMWLPDGNIEFLGRIDYQVKLAGIRIEPGEIENCLLTFDGIDEAAVVVKGNEEKYLCSYIVSEKRVDDVALRVWLSEKLPYYMIPAVFIQLEKMPVTQNRKIKRKLLIALEIEIDTTSYYIAPGNEIEEKLVEIWAEVLNRPKGTISVEGNFFEMGGHSLKAITIIAKTHKTFNVMVPLAEMFKIPSIRGVSQYIKKTKEEKHTSIKAVEKKEFYASSSAQKRLYILQQMELSSAAYNMPTVIPLGEEPDLEMFEETFIKLINRHESLRTSFHMVEHRLIQRVHDRVDFKIEYYEITGNEGSRVGGSFRVSEAQVIRRFGSAFDMSKAPLIKAGIVKIDKDRHVLVAVLHHIISDGVSLQVLENDFMELYEGKELAPLRIHYKDFSEWQDREKGTERLKRQEAYWLKEFEGEIPVLNLPIDYPRPTVQLFKGAVLSGEIPIDIHRLKAIALENGATTFMVLLTIFNIYLYKICGQEDIIIGTPVAGRRHSDLEKIIGMFVNALPLRNRPAGEKSFIEFLKEVRDRTLKAFENQEYQFEDLVEKLLVKRDRHNPVFDVMFNCVEQEVEQMPDPSSEPKPYVHNDQGTSKFDFTLNMTAADKLLFSFEYSSELFKKETIEMFAHGLNEVVSDIMENTKVHLDDIRITTVLADTDVGGIEEELTGMEF